MPFKEIDSNKRTEENPKTYKHGAIEKPLESDERKLKVRQRQIDIGKNTEGYRLYVADVPR